MRKLDLDKLQSGHPGVSRAAGTFFAQAAACLLDQNGFRSGVQLKVEGLFNESFEVIWTEKIDDTIRRTFGDKRELTEYAATAIAALLVEQLLNMRLVERSFQSTNVDYLIGELNAQLGPIYQGLVEISGIKNASSKNSVNRRLNIKIQQAKKTPLNYPTYIVVVDFGQPKAKIKKL